MIEQIPMVFLVKTFGPLFDKKTCVHFWISLIVSAAVLFDGKAYDHLEKWSTQ